MTEPIVFWELWDAGTPIAAIEDAFESPGALDGALLRFAAYSTPAYEGYALVVFERDGLLWEVNGSHCSCMGLEGQWQPEETSWGALKTRDGISYGEDPQWDAALLKLATAEVG